MPSFRTYTFKTPFSLGSATVVLSKRRHYHTLRQSLFRHSPIIRSAKIRNTAFAFSFDALRFKLRVMIHTFHFLTGNGAVILTEY